MAIITDTSGSLWKFKRDEKVDLTVDDNHILNNSSSLKYKVLLVIQKIME